MTISRAESLRLHPKRHALTMDYEVGCDEDGRLVAVRARIVGDTGAYASVGAKVLERAAGHQFHGDGRRAVDFLGAVNVNAVGMVDRSGQPALAQEAFARLR